MGKLYNLLRYKREKPIGNGNWMGNLRWWAEEDEVPFSYTFSTVPVDISDGEIPAGDIWPPNAKRILFNLSIENHGRIREYCYSPDHISIDSDEISYKLSFPWDKYGAIVSINRNKSNSNVRLLFKGSMECGRRNKNQKSANIFFEGNKITYLDGNYHVTIKHNGSVEAEGENSLAIKPNRYGETKIALSYHIDGNESEKQAEDLFGNTGEVLGRSMEFWENYLASCPTVKFDNDYTYYKVLH